MKPIDLQSLLLHEIGHVIGVGHSDVTTAVMCGFIAPSPGFDGSGCGNIGFIARQLDPDDIAAIQTLYGMPTVPPAATKVPQPMHMLVIYAGALSLLAAGNIRQTRCMSKRFA